MKKRHRWLPPPEPVPKRPYRDTVLVFGAMAAVVVLAAWLTGGDVVTALVVAGAFFAVATVWTWRRFRERIRAEAADQESRP